MIFGPTILTATILNFALAKLQTGKHESDVYFALIDTVLEMTLKLWQFKTVFMMWHP